MILAIMKMGKNQKHDAVMQCLKEGKHRVLQSIENWTEERSIVGFTNINGVARREHFSEVDKQMCQPRVIVKHNKRAQIFFKVQTQLSVRQLAES